MDKTSVLGLDENLSAKIKAWMESPYDVETRQKIQDLIDTGQVEELTNAFYQDLAFGTGGLRGIMGIGSNRMNKYTVGKATQGFSQYLHKQFSGQKIQVAIAYDSRNQSKEFAELVASVFSANNIHVHLFTELRPTPLLSYALRRLKCNAGVMITASHNPKEYNGYKAYWQDGGQLVPPHDQGVMDAIGKITNPAQILWDPALKNVSEVGAEMDLDYIAQMLHLKMRPDVVQRQKQMKIVFSPIHGTGSTIVPDLLARWGFERVHNVGSQMIMDGDFPTVTYPNPEEREAMLLALEEAKSQEAELVIATDPDADRVGVAIPTKFGDESYRLLSGNQIGSLLVHYVLSSLQDSGQLDSQRDYIVKTIVTTELIKRLAEYYKVDCYDVLTGFKYIGELMTSLESDRRFLVGGEESYGFLVGDAVRDKDAVISCALIAEMTAFYKDQGKTLEDALIALYEKHGLYHEKLVSLTKTGKKGADEINAIMQNLRAHPPQALGGIRLKQIKDYQESLEIDLRSQQSQPLNFPKSNVLQFITEEGDVITARPSGTEPKIKFYCSVLGQLERPEQILEREAELEEKIDRMMGDLIQ